MSQSYVNVFVSQSVTSKRSQEKYTFLSHWDSFAISGDIVFENEE